MPGKTPQQDGKEILTGKGEDGSPDPDVLALHAVLRAFALGDSFHALNSKVRENDRLRQRLDDLQITYSTNLRTLSEMNEELVDKDTQHAKALGAQQEKLDSAIEAKKKAVADLAAMKKSLADKSSDVKDLDIRIQKLIRENKDKDTRIHALEEAERLRRKTAEEAKNREDQLREQLATATDELRAQGGRLKQASDGLDLVRSFIVPLTTISDNGDNIYNEFKGMFEGAYRLMRKWLHRDLEDSYLGNRQVWKAINNHPAIPGNLPLPKTNSLSAKDMRVAAGLLVLARSVAHRILRPTYLLQDGGIDSVLSALAEHDAYQEAYLRAALLKVFPDRQEQGREDGIRTAVQEIVDAVAGWIPQAEIQGFRSDLEGVANKIADSWPRVQMLEESIKPSFKRGQLQTWKPLPAQSTTRPAGPAAAQTQHKSTKPQTKQEPAGTARHADEAVEVSIWPAFLHMGVEQADEVLVFHGFGLTPSQMAGAEEEASARGARKIGREDQATKGSDKRRNSRSFLFGIPSNGSNAA